MFICQTVCYNGFEVTYEHHDDQKFGALLVGRIPETEARYETDRIGIRSDCRSVSQYDLGAGLDANCNYFNVTWLKFTGKRWSRKSGGYGFEGVHPEDKGCCMDTYLASFERRESFEMEYRLKRHDGLWRWINDRGVPTFGRGAPVHRLHWQLHGRYREG